MKKIMKTKYFTYGLIIGLGLLSVGAYASVTGAGTIGSLFEKIGNSYVLLGNNIKNNTIDNSKLDNSGTYELGKLGIGTSNPTESLDVIGNVKTYSLYTKAICDYNGNNCLNLDTTFSNCGTANGTIVSSQPTTNLCSTGTVYWQDTLAFDGTYNWICKTQSGGTTDFCSAIKQSNCGPITITLSGTTYTYNTKLMPDGKCWTSENMRHPPKLVKNFISNYTERIKYMSWWGYFANNKVNYGSGGLLYTWWAAMGCENQYNCDIENVSKSVCGQLGSGWHLPYFHELRNLTVKLGCSYDPNDPYRCDIVGWNSLSGVKKLGGLLNTTYGSFRDIPWGYTPSRIKSWWLANKKYHTDNNNNYYTPWSFNEYLIFYSLGNFSDAKSVICVKG